jgi:flagellar hook-length control protein FliK
MAYIIIGLNLQESKMATDINAAKLALVTDSGSPSTKSTGQNSKSGIDFSDIIRKSANRLENGLSIFSDRAGITGLSERADNTPAADDYSQYENDTPNDNTRSRANTDDHTNHGQERDVSDVSHHTVDYDNDGTQNDKPEMMEASSDKHADKKNHGENTQRDERLDKGGDTSSQETRDDSTVEVSNINEANKNNGSNAAGKEKDKELLSNLIAKPEASNLSGQTYEQDTKQNPILPGQANEQAHTNTQGNMGAKNSAEGSSKTTVNAFGQFNSNINNTGQSGANTQNTQAATQGHNLSDTPLQAKAQNAISTETQAATEAQLNVSSKANEQAAQLSKMVGGGKKIDVSVTVTDEKSTLVSKPTANLLSGTILAADTTKASLRSQQEKGSGSTKAEGLTQLAAGQAAEVKGQAVGATGQAQRSAGAQAQSTNAVSNNIKGAAQVNLHMTGAQGNLSGNGETPVAAAPNSISAAQQAQQNTSTQAANATRFTTVNHAVVEQVSVQISKALNAGNDRISIQLKPADLGRIDVQMEVAQDGRVTAVVTADNKQTLDLLQKDSKQLQEALQQAGLQADDDSLNFNLREQGDGQEMAGTGSSGANEGTGDELTLEEELAGIKPDIITDTRIDVRA